MPKKVARHHVYVIQLDPAVLEHATFRAANPNHDPRKPPLYVGMTGLDPETRFERHKWLLARELRSDGYAVWQK